MEFLYDAGVDLECIDSSGRLPIHLAALHGGTVLYNLLYILLYFVVICCNLLYLLYIATQVFLSHVIICFLLCVFMSYDEDCAFNLTLFITFNF